MPVIVIENKRDIKGFISLKQNTNTVSMDLYIEVSNNSISDSFDIYILKRNDVFHVCTIGKNNISKYNENTNVYKGKILDLDSDFYDQYNGLTTIIKGNTPNDNYITPESRGESIRLINRISANELFMDFEVTNSRIMNGKEIACESTHDKKVIEIITYDNIDSITTLDTTEPIEKTSNGVLTNNEIEINHESILIEDTAEINSSNFDSESSQSIELANKIEVKASNSRRTKVDNNKMLIAKLSYYSFSKIVLDKNIYFNTISTIFNMAKAQIFKYDHIMLSIIFKRNTESIKSIQIGIPSKKDEIVLKGLDNFKYSSSLCENEIGYWIYNYEI